MRICLICVEIFAWGKYGGFGRATRIIGRELVKKGVEVYAVVPRRQDQKPVEELDGITVLNYPRYSPLSAMKLYKECNADIYHSAQPSMGTFLAMKSMPDRKHVITFRDPRDMWDWYLEFDRPSLSKLQVLSNLLYESNPLESWAVRHADGVFSNARYLIPKIRSMYHLNSDPVFLPTPVSVPSKIDKSGSPTVCFLARLDRRKRPELFLELAKSFPDVRFITFGRSRDEQWDRYLRETYGELPNMEILGFVDQFTSILHSEILEKSWVMVNTATREALPNAFLESAAHECAILSYVDPDGFASNFGYHAADEDFARGLSYLLEGERWKERGRRGREYVKQTFEMDLAISQHMDVYGALLK